MINVPTAQSSVFLCSRLHLVTSFDVLVYLLSKALSQKNKKMPSKHTILTLLIPVKQALNCLTLWRFDLEDPKPVETIDGFTTMSDAELEGLIKNYGLAMTLADLK